MFKRLFYYFIQWTWAFPQNLAGFLLWVLCGSEKHNGNYKNAVITNWDNDRSMSLGMFLFIGYGGGMRMIKHEYGHSIQSLMLGPLYLFVVGIPSLIWCNYRPVAWKWKSGMVSYFSKFPESWADRLGFSKDDIV